MNNEQERVRQNGGGRAHETREPCEQRPGADESSVS